MVCGKFEQARSARVEVKSRRDLKTNVRGDSDDVLDSLLGPS